MEFISKLNNYFYHKLFIKTTSDLTEVALKVSYFDFCKQWQRNCIKNGSNFNCVGVTPISSFQSEATLVDQGQKKFLLKQQIFITMHPTVQAYSYLASILHLSI